MKRVIDGVSYNTATSFKKAVHIKRGDDDRHVTCYVTRKGQTFYHVQKHQSTEGHLQDWFDGDLGDTVFWDEVHSLDEPGKIIEKTILIRMPSVLKQRIQERAENDSISVNAWIVDALQSASSPVQPKSKAPIDAEARSLASKRASERLRSAVASAIRDREAT